MINHSITNHQSAIEQKIATFQSINPHYDMNLFRSSIKELAVSSCSSYEQTIDAMIHKSLKGEKMPWD